MPAKPAFSTVEKPGELLPPLAGELTATPTADSLRFRVERSLKTQGLDRAKIRYVKMWVWGPGMAQKIWNSNAFVDVNALQGVTLEIPGIPKGENRLVTALGFDANQELIPGAVLRAYYSSPASQGTVTIRLTLGWRFNPLGDAMEALLAKGSPALATLNLNQVQGQIDQALFGGQAPSNTFAVHPSRISAVNLASQLEKGQVPAAAALVPAGAGTEFVVKPNPQGGVLANGAVVIVDDPASPPFNIPAGSDRVVLSGLGIGTWNAVVRINTPNGIQEIPFTVTVDNQGNVSTSKGTGGAPLVAPPVITSVNNVYAAPVYNGLAGWWKGNGDANDSAGTSHGTLFNGATQVAGKFSQAFSFDGTNDRFQAADSAALRPTRLTAAAWVYPRSLNGDWDIVVARDAGVRSWNLQADSATGGPCLNRPAFSIFIGAANFFTCGPAALPLNQWSHLAGTVDGADVKLYVNGALAGQAAAPGNLDAAAGTPLTIGSDGNPSNFFDGLVDEVAVHDRALTAAEILALFNGKSIVLNGEGFDATPANNAVLLGGSAATVTRATASALTVLVPPTLFGPVPVKVTTANQASNQPNVSLLPAIDSLSARLGVPGDNITIAGTNFQPGNTTVRFNGTLANVAGVTNTSLTATVPAGATDGAVTVTTSGGTATGPAFTLSPGGLIGWWKGEGNVSDSVGTNHGTLVNGTTYAAGKVGQGFNLDGNNDFVNIPDHNSLDFALATDFSVGYWFNAETAKPKQRIVSKGSSGCSNGWHTALTGASSMQFELADGGGCDQVNFSVGYTLNNWEHHFFTTNKALNQIRFYRNGQFVQNMGISRAHTFSSSGFDLVFGYDAQANNEYFDGRIDEVQLYNRRLSDAEVLAIFDATK